MLKTHLDIISRNEPVQRKARFWSSYMRALKGTDDMRAPEQSARTPRSVFRPLYAEFPEVASKLDSWPYSKSIYDEPTHATERISSPGYRYQPISRDTYGYSPRSTYRPAEYEPYNKPGKCTEYEPDNKPGKFTEYEPYNKPVKHFEYEPYNKPEDYAWNAHMLRMAEIESKYPKNDYSDWESKYPSPSTYRPSVYRPVYRIPYALTRASPPPAPRYSWRQRSPVSEPLSDKAIGFTYSGLPIYSPVGGLSKLAMYDLLNPSPNTPVSRICRDPWWWKYPELRPFNSHYSWQHSPAYLRNSYLSPVKSTYLWTHHPIRPFCKYLLRPLTV